MAEPRIPYQLMVARALRAVAREALCLGQSQGFGEHHFFITFRTAAVGVRMSARLQAQHPDEMTIVLQHQFRDLQVGADAFSVTLSFDGRQEGLTVPFEAMISFSDPFAKFGLSFDAVNGDNADASGGVPSASETLVPSLGDDVPPEESTATDGDLVADENVVSLDRFRRR